MAIGKIGDAIAESARAVVTRPTKCCTMDEWTVRWSCSAAT